jgi:hypothetical protein
MSLFGKKSRPSILDVLAGIEGVAVFEVGGNGGSRQPGETSEQHDERIAAECGLSAESLKERKALSDAAARDVERKFKITSEQEKRLMDTAGLAMLSVGTGIIQRAMEVGVVNPETAIRCFEAACEKLVVTNDAARPLAAELLAKEPQPEPAPASKSDA